MFCDLIGSTGLFEELDPEEVGELMRAFRQCCAERIEAAGGFVAQFQGDGVIGYFGYTEASESNAERAVRAGLDIVRQVPRLPAPDHAPLQTRVGIATGLAVVGDPRGLGTRLEQSAVGQTLHLAARLQAVAAPNQVIVAHSTRRLTGDLFICRSAEKLMLKGFSDPVQTWRVMGPRPIVTQLRTRWQPLLTPMVNRKLEVEVLSAAYQRVTAGQGRIVTLFGDAGIGKSRLVNELRWQIGPLGHLWLEAGGAQFFQNTPFYPVAQMIRRVLDPTGRKPPAEVRARLEAALKEAGVHAPSALPLLTEMLGLGGAASTVPPEERRIQLLSTLADWMVSLARSRAVVMAVEDLHWADPSTLELIGFLLPRISRLPVLMLLSTRPDFRPPWSDPDHASRLHLQRLTDDHMHQIVTATRGALRSGTLKTARDPNGGPSDDAIAAIVQRAGGVPLFGIELTRLLEEQNGRTGGRAIPATLAALLAARLDQLGAAAKRIAQAAAAFGDTIPLQVLEAILDMPTARLRRQLATLKRKAVLQEERPGSNPVYRFSHSLLRDSAYDALPRADRRALHQRIATVLESRFQTIAAAQPELLAYQWTEAGELARGAAAWQGAGDLFRLSRAFSEAEWAYQKAAEALGGLPESMERDIQELALRSLLAGVLQITRGYSAPPTIEAFDRVRVLAERTGDQAQRCRHVFGAWAAASSGGDYQQASRLADQLYQMAMDDPTRHAQAFMVQMTARLRVGDLLRAEAFFQQGQKHFLTPSFERTTGAIAQTYGNAAQLAYFLGDDEAAQQRAEHALLIARRNDSAYDLAAAQFMVAAYQIHVGHYSLAAELSSESIRLSDQHGFPQFGTIARISLGRARAGLGLAADGVALIREGLAGMARTSSRVALTIYMTWLAEAHLMAGSLDEALATVQEALDVNPQELFFRPETLRLHGEILLCDGRPGEAEREFLHALALARQMGAARFVNRATASLRRLLRSRGDISDTFQQTATRGADRLALRSDAGD